MAKITDTTLNDVKNAAEEKFDDVKESVEETVDAAEDRVNRLSPAKKVVLITTGVLVGYSVASAVLRRVLSRHDQVIEGDIIVVTEDEIQE